MIEISADEAIYTRVESAFSPRRRAGYQIAYQDEGVESEESSNFEQRVNNCDTRSVTRWQFFHSPRGRAVITRTVFVDPDAEITDRNSRPSFLVHALFLSESDFRKISCNPFRVIDGFSGWLESAHDMVERYMKASRLESTRLMVDDRDPFDTLGAGPEQRRLVAWAVRVATDRSAAVVAPAEKVEAVLRAAFYYLSERHRPHLTFDTHVARNVPKPGAYCCVGSPERFSGMGFEYLEADVDLATESFGPVDDSDLYGRWVLSASREADHDPELAPRMRAACEAFASGRMSAELVDDAAACEAFAAAFPTELQNRLRERAGRALTPDGAADSFLAFVNGSSGPAERFRLAADAGSVFLAHLVFSWLVERRGLASPKEHDSIRALSDAARHPGLSFLAAVWSPRRFILGQKIDVARRDVALAAMTNAQFSALMALTPDKIAPANFVSSRFADELFAHLAGATVEAGQLIDLVDASINARVVGRIDPIADQLHALSPRWLEKLRRRLIGRDSAADVLADRIDGWLRAPGECPELEDDIPEARARRSKQSETDKR